MKITIAAVGKLKEAYLKDAQNYFSQQIAKHCEIEIVEIPDEKIQDNNLQSHIDYVKNTEGDNLLKKISHDHYVIALAIDGEQLNTIQLRKKFFHLTSENRKNIMFVIGGSLGLSDKVLKRADFKLSFSPMTFPHQLMRIILLEQISLIMQQ